jgi:DNA repair exonuclease SbcCD nuclease subunit
MTERVLIASDLHLSQRIWQHRPIFGDSYSSWRQLVQYAIDYEVTAVILAGDLLDRQSNTSEPVCEFAAGLNRLIEAGIEVFYVQGQHEMQEVPWASLAKGVQHINDKLVDIARLKVYGMDFRSATQLQASLAQIPPEANVLVAHQVWSDFMGDIVHSQGSFADIPSHIELLITGDYHKTVCQQLPSGMQVLSPGSTHMRAINEPAEKYGHLLTVQDDGSVQWQALELLTRPVLMWDLREGVDEPALLFARCREELLAAENDTLRDAGNSDAAGAGALHGLRRRILSGS